MNSNQLILKIANRKIWFNDTEFVPFEHTNIPFKYLSFHHRDIYWLVVMTGFNKEYGRLRLNVVDYNYSQHLGFSDQTPKNKIKFLVFEKFYWKKLEPLLYFYQRIKFADQLLAEESNIPLEEQIVKDAQHLQSLEFEDLKDPVSSQKNNSLHTSITSEFSNEFAMSIEKCKFQSGYVECPVYVHKIKQTVALKIYNRFLLPEFDHIKNWFAKRLGKHKFNIIAHFKLSNFDITEYSATSQDIDMIDSQFIESVKILRTRHLSKTINTSDPNKVLFTSEDIFNLICNAEENLFEQDEQDIINIFTGSEGIRHKDELLYLSTNRQSMNHTIRFTTRPHFGFLFTVEGTIANHFIWELLETHATYIWTINKTHAPMETQYNIIESEISKIFKTGREEYKKVYKNLEKKNEFAFNTIHHREQGGLSNERYSKWRRSFNEIVC